MTDTATTAAAVSEHRYNLGPADYSLADALDPEFLDTGAEDVDERWEREGRREMYETLGLWGA